MNPRTLLVYGTSYGQTAKIATRIESILRDRGHAVTVANAAEPLPFQSLADFDAIVVGSSIIARGHQKSVEEFIRKEAVLLNSKPSAFYSVSGSAGSTSPVERATAERLRDEFLTRVAWTPRIRVSFAGAVNYTRYNFLLRWYMKKASAKGGGSTDTSRDHEYTDWNQVERFAVEVAGLVRREEPAFTR